MATSYSMPQLNYVSPYQNSANAFNFGSSYTPNQSLINGVTGNSYLDATAPMAAFNPDYSLNYNNGSGFDWSGLSGGGDNSGAGSLQNTLGMNIPTFQLGLSGISTLGNLWGAFQSSKLANEQFDFSKNMANKNLANQTQSYNTALSDKATARASMEGWSDSQTQDYINKIKLSS